MWKYTKEPDTNIPETIITKEYIKDAFYEDDKPVITEEAVDYIRELMRPLISAMNACQTTVQLNEIYQTLPYDKESEINTDFYLAKKDILDYALDLLIHDKEEDEPGMSRNQDIVDPWIIRRYIESHDRLKSFFHPGPIMVDVNFNEQQFPLELNYEQLLGIMAIYRYLHKDSPFTMYGHIIQTAIDDVNKRALEEQRNKEFDDNYNVTIGNDVFAFRNLDFFQGCITGCNWNGLDIHSTLTNLKQWKRDSPVGIPPLPSTNLKQWNSDIPQFSSTLYHVPLTF